MSRAPKTTETNVAKTLARAHPGLFIPEPQDPDFGGSYWVARSPCGDPLCDILLNSSFGEITVGLGSMAHTHFDFSDAPKALALIGDLLCGKLGSFDEIGHDGRVLSGRFVEADKTSSCGASPARGAVLGRMRFFSGLGNFDLFL